MTSEYEWTENPNGIDATVDGALLLINKRTRGRHCATEPWGWEVCWDDVDRDVVWGRCRTLEESVRAVEEGYRDNHAP